MVKVWIHKRGGTEPYLVTDMSLSDCSRQFDLQDARYLQPLGRQPLSAATPGPLGADPNPDLVVFEIPTHEQTAQLKPGHYASRMQAGSVLELIGEE